MSQKTLNARIRMKADTSAHWNTASSAGFKVLPYECIFYTDAVNCIPLKVNLASVEASPNSLDFIAEFASDAEVTAAVNSILGG